MSNGQGWAQAYRPFQAFSVFHITNTIQYNTIIFIVHIWYMRSWAYMRFFFVKSGQNLPVRVMRSTELNWNGLSSKYIKRPLSTHFIPLERLTVGQMLYSRHSTCIPDKVTDNGINKEAGFCQTLIYKWIDPVRNPETISCRHNWVHSFLGVILHHSAGNSGELAERFRIKRGRDK